MSYKSQSFGNLQKWAGGCGLWETKAFHSAEDSIRIDKILSCDSNLCNNPKKLKDLKDFLLCEEGFYGYNSSFISSSSKIFSILVFFLFYFFYFLFYSCHEFSYDFADDIR